MRLGKNISYRASERARTQIRVPSRNLIFRQLDVNLYYNSLEALVSKINRILSSRVNGIR